MSIHDALCAVRRFGLGPKPGEIARIAADPRGALLASFAPNAAPGIAAAALEPSHAVYAASQAATMDQRIAKAFAKEGQDTLKPAPAVTMPADGNAARQEMAAVNPAAPAKAPVVPPPPLDKPTKIRREAFNAEAAARVGLAHTTDHPFVERLVMFWSNHFCVNANKGAVLGLAGAYEREAIRPHVLGRFADMLKAVEQHPAMLIYLDNQASTGPNSQAGRNRKVGLNENLAREILELHTLGVDGGYTQDDVTNLARVITGWTVGNYNQPQTTPGRFFFAANRHEPGEWTVLGKRYVNGSVATGEACLADLARHPSTARFIARKLAAHFVSDTPPPALVARLERTFRDSDGDLKALATTLVRSDEAWSEAPRKVLPPYDYAVALMRGFSGNLPPEFPVNVSVALGQPLWRPPSPKGWPDTDDAWIGSAAMRERLRVAERATRAVAPGLDPREAAELLFGAALSEPSRQAVARAEIREQGFELLMMSPEFQRR